MSQVAIIKDVDGFTNVRKEANVNAEVLGKVEKNYVFWYDLETYNTEEDWILVSVPVDTFSISSTNTNDDYLVGYIHKSRINPINKLTPAAVDEFSFSYQLSPFDSLGKVIARSQNRWITTIDDKQVWGTDGDLPKTQVNGIIVHVNSKEFKIRKALFSDLYQCSEVVEMYKDYGCYFVFQNNSDGAGYYEIVWVITERGEVVQRLVGNMY